MPENRDPLSVSDLVFQIKNSLERQFSLLVVEGEVSNLSRSATGHWYFSLSDGESLVNVALFRGDAMRNPLISKVREGDKLILTGSLGVYHKRGSFQVIAKSLRQAGVGDLKAQFEKLKLKLQSEGLFDPEIKKPIPKLPRRVAVVTAKGAAALQDFLNIFNRRSERMDILISPCLVQGDKAPTSIIKALRKVIKYSLESEDGQEVDVIVLTRGGGSLEDLWAFNDEALAWEIYQCPIPIISAVGHQVDFSLSDFVADLRVETPSAAAEYLTQSEYELRERLNRRRDEMIFHMRHRLMEVKNRLSDHRPAQFVDKLRERAAECRRVLHRNDLMHRATELLGVFQYQMRLDEAIQKIQRLMVDRINRWDQQLEKSFQKINLLNPKNVLGRGYSIVYDKDHHVISTQKSFSKYSNGSKFILEFSDGKESVTKENE